MDKQFFKIGDRLYNVSAIRWIEPNDPWPGNLCVGIHQGRPVWHELPEGYTATDVMRQLSEAGVVLDIKPAVSAPAEE